MCKQEEEGEILNDNNKYTRSKVIKVLIDILRELIRCHQDIIYCISFPLSKDINFHLSLVVF